MIVVLTLEVCLIQRAKGNIKTHHVIHHFWLPRDSPSMREASLYERELKCQTLPFVLNFGAGRRNTFRKIPYGMETCPIHEACVLDGGWHRKGYSDAFC